MIFQITLTLAIHLDYSFVYIILFMIISCIVYIILFMVLMVLKEKDKECHVSGARSLPVKL